ncbi:MAG: hypothetical protein KAW94_04455 [Candidatus Thorarchaeota archaeon]|nr:hypothetical protein [Candidatus Thorarchaeota archaeon]
MENPQIRALLEIRKDLEDQLEEFRNRVEKIEGMIEELDSVIGMGSFSSADAVLGGKDTAAKDTTEAADDVPEEPNTIVVLNKARNLELGTMAVVGPDVTILPAEHAQYDIKRGAFARFFVERILGQFQREDRQRVENGELEWSEAFDFEVQAEDGILLQLVIRNFGSSSRLEEIQRTLRWALEKTYRAR